MQSLYPATMKKRDFLIKTFIRLQKKTSSALCFVNDGSKDKTLAALSGIQAACPTNICVHSLAQNAGISEAVRKGMSYMYQNFEVNLLGFLDADLTTKL